jgi:hypothetical protein
VALSEGGGGLTVATASNNSFAFDANAASTSIRDFNSASSSEILFFASLSPDCMTSGKSGKGH